MDEVTLEHQLGSHKQEREDETPLRERHQLPAPNVRLVIGFTRFNATFLFCFFFPFNLCVTNLRIKQKLSVQITPPRGSGAAGSGLTATASPLFSR